MKKYLITGFSGFVSRHFIRYICKKYDQIEILGLDMKTPDFDYREICGNANVRFLKKNLLDDNLYEIFQSFRPDYVLHLASFSSVAYAWEHPSESYLNNTNIFLNIVMAIYKCGFETKILSVGSSEEYGNVSEEKIPIRESCEMAPLSPYAVARFSQEHLSRVFVDSYGLNIVMTRSFNHIGVGQDERFVIPSFIRRILEIKHSGMGQGIIETGDLSIVRDFTNVEDVVKAYDILLDRGKSGEVYNICSGQGLELRSIVEMIADICGIVVETVVNPRYLRPNDNKKMIGSYEKIKKEFGWQPEIDLRTTLKEMIAHMENQIYFSEKD